LVCGSREGNKPLRQLGYLPRDLLDLTRGSMGCWRHEQRTHTSMSFEDIWKPEIMDMMGTCIEERGRSRSSCSSANLIWLTRRVCVCCDRVPSEQWPLYNYTFFLSALLIMSKLLVDVHTHLYLPRYASLLRSRSVAPCIRSIITPEGNKEDRLVILDNEPSGGRPVGPQYWDRDGTHC